MAASFERLSIQGLTAQYRNGGTTPAAVIAAIFARIKAEGVAPVWIALADEAEAMRQAEAWDPSKPLSGIPFAVKDNIDVEGLPTTAGCPSFAYLPKRSAVVVSRLLEAGAILIGKTNMDQFATGLVGVRSPYGACSSVFDERYISGGSSSGSAVAVARGLCAFSLGTDTAGSGRVPAAFNDLVGLKPTRGVLSASGVVPACRSLDCVSIFATSTEDAAAVWQVAHSSGDTDADSRAMPVGADAAPWLSDGWRFGVPREADLEFFGDPHTPALFQQAVERLTAMGGTPVTIDLAPFRQAAALLYSGPWVAERFAAVGDFLSKGPADADPTVAGIILSATKYSAADVYRALEQLESLKRQAAVEWSQMDVLLLPTAGTTYTRMAVAADPVGLNANLGYYTNFVNLMDLAAIAIPAGFTPRGLPFGVSLIAPAFSDRALLTLAGRVLDEPVQEPAVAPGCVALAVVGAHLSGQPLNFQLTDRGARLMTTCQTSSEYQLFALPGTTPLKPGLVRAPGFRGGGIEVEVWAMPEQHLGSFVAAIPPPLGIGSVQLATGEWVKGFICEPCAIDGAQDVTAFGGWRRYLAARTVSGPRLVS
jgi:allophanate hydrolase